MLFERLDRRVEARSEDLSRHGVFVRTEELLPVGAETEITLLLPDGGEARFVARIAHLLPPSAARALGRHPGMGLQFLDADDDSAAALRRYLAQLEDDLGPAAAPATPGATIVVAEASAPLRARLEAALSAAGFGVAAYADGATALAACVVTPPAAIVAAAGLPGLGSARLLEVRAGSARLAGVPVVLLSDGVDENARLEAYRQGADDVIARPFVEEELVIRVGRLASRRAALVAAEAGAAGVGRAGASLAGALAEIATATLLSLLAFERKSGVLLLVAGTSLGRLALRDGAVVRADLDGAPGDARARALALLDWAEGSFEFTAAAVDGADEVGLPTTALLLEHARLADERRRGDGEATDRS